MTELVEVAAGPARLVLAPAMGGGIARLDVAGRALLRPWAGDPHNAFSLASNILVPFSNRISSGGFDWHGQRHDLAPNLTGEPFPIHGDGFQKPWRVVERKQRNVILSLEDGQIGPFHYSGRQHFHLDERSLGIELTLTNTGSGALPFGCGFHPWFPRDLDTRVRFAAKAVWMEDHQHLPTHLSPLDEAPDWDFAATRALPDGLINNAYTGWSGEAQIIQGEAFVSARLSASSNLDVAIVHSVDKNCGFFCLEPVSHAVDAINQPGHPGLTILAPNQSITAFMRLDW